MHKFFSYIFFLFRSTNQHGVHSPFVYSFVTKCLYNKTNFTDYKLLKAYRSKLKYSKIELEIEDFGQGSRLMNANKRRVSKMITNSSSTFSTTKLLYRISSYFKFKNTLELGTSLGIGTQALALGNSENKVTTIEGCTNTFNFTKNNLKLPQNNQIQFINSEFKNILPTLETTHYDCIFFDGHHNKKATLDYFETLLSKTHNNTVFIFDDIYWSKDMTAAWKQIINHQKVTVSIDCFKLGFVFFRKEQLKQHFKIRL